MSLEEALPFIVKAAEAAWWVILSLGGGTIGLLIYIWKQRSGQTDKLIEATSEMGKELHTMSDNVEGLNSTVTKQWKMIQRHETDIAVIKSKINNGAT